MDRKKIRKLIVADAKMIEITLLSAGEFLFEKRLVVPSGGSWRFWLRKNKYHGERHS